MIEDERRALQETTHKLRLSLKGEEREKKELLERIEELSEQMNTGKIHL